MRLGYFVKKSNTTMIQGFEILKAREFFRYKIFQFQFEIHSRLYI